MSAYYILNGPVVEDHDLTKADPASTVVPLRKAHPDAPHARAPPFSNLPDGQLSKKRSLFNISTEDGTVDWVATTHTFPAAYPRSHPTCTSPPGVPLPQPTPLPVQTLQSDEAEKAIDKKLRTEQLKLWNSLDFPCETEKVYHLPRSKADGEKRAQEGVEGKEPQLWGVVERIVPFPSHKQTGNKPVTLLLMHATGFHKEIYHPFLRALLQQLADSKSDLQVDEIWSFDAANSGESAHLNKDSFGQTTRWVDTTRDILQFIKSYMPRSVSKGDAPTILNEVSGSSMDRRIVAIGHSFGGAAFGMAANVAPELFERFIMLDPVLIPIQACAQDKDIDSREVARRMRNNALAISAGARKEVWSSRAAAEANFKSKKLFQMWDPEVLDIHLRDALTPLPGAGGQVTLTMSKWLEGVTFLDGWRSVFIRAAIASGVFKRYHQNRPDRGATHIVIMTKGQRALYLEELAEYIGEEPSKALRGSVDLMEGGHLVVQDQPARAAKVVLAYLHGQAPSQDDLGLKERL